MKIEIKIIKNIKPIQNLINDYNIFVNAKSIIKILNERIYKGKFSLNLSEIIKELEYLLKNGDDMRLVFDGHLIYSMIMKSLTLLILIEYVFYLMTQAMT